MLPRGAHLTLAREDPWISITRETPAPWGPALAMPGRQSRASSGEKPPLIQRHLVALSQSRVSGMETRTPLCASTNPRHLQGGLASLGAQEAEHVNP